MIDKDTPIPTPREGEYNTITGVFEGGGYASEGIFSPFMDCMMNRMKIGFCPACERAIIEMINLHIK